MQTLYSAVVTAKAGRGGHASGSDPQFDMDLSVPKGLGGPGGAGTNPEQLFAAGYAACFGGAASLVAGQKKLKPSHVKITAKVDIGKVGEGLALAVELTCDFGDLARPDAQAVMEGAHKICPYSNATRGNVDVKLKLA